MFYEQHWSTALIKIFPTPENNMVWKKHVSWKQLMQYTLILMEAIDAIYAKFNGNNWCNIC